MPPIKPCAPPGVCPSLSGVTLGGDYAGKADDAAMDLGVRVPDSGGWVDRLLRGADDRAIGRLCAGSPCPNAGKSQSIGDIDLH